MFKMRILGVVFLCFSLLSVNRPAGANECTDALEKISEESYFQFGPNLEFKGLTPEGLKVVSKARDRIRKLYKLFPTQLFDMDAHMHAINVAKLGRWSAILAGPPGGSKTGIVFSLTPDIWAKQVHEMMNETAIIGGQTQKGSEEGVEDINTKGTIVHAKYVLLDELDKANPALLATILSAMNRGERSVYIQGKRVPILTRAFFLSSNATLYELIENFIQRGQGTTGPAFLNRAEFKLYVPNWLEESSQEQLFKISRRVDYLKAISKHTPDAEKELEALKLPQVDWEKLEDVAFTLFKTDDYFDATFLAFINKLRQKTHEDIRTSEQEHQDDPIGHPHVLVPPAEFSTRLMKEISRVVMASSLIDFLLSPLADEANLKKNTSRQIELGPLSLWRSYPVFTAVGPGKVVFNPETRQIIFNGKAGRDGQIQPMDMGQWIANAKDSRDRQELEFMLAAQERFQKTLQEQWNILERSNREAAALSSDLDDVDLESVEFETILHRVTRH